MIHLLITAAVFLCAQTSSAETVLWTQSMPSTMQIKPAVSLNNRVVYVGSATTLFALDSETGNVNWKVNVSLTSGTDSEPVIDRFGVLYVGTSNGIVGVNTKTGTVMKSFALPKRASCPSLLSHKNLLCSSSNDNKIYAVNAISMRMVWSYDLGYPTDATPIFSPDGGVVYVGNQNYMFAIHTANGTLKWKTPVDDFVCRAAGITPDGSVLFYGTNGGNLYATSTKDGSNIWTVKGLGSVWGVPAISLRLGRVYVGSWANDVYAFDIETGRKTWSQKIDQAIINSVVLNSQETRLMAAGRSGDLMFFNVTTGNMTRRLTLGGQVIPPTLSNRRSSTSRSMIFVAGGTMVDGISDDV
eukprot:m.80134 g.80134  ORF g.80134 m.80134 type:complete len:356 (-) comp12743_c0_seq9:98-1165(-)